MELQKIFQSGEERAVSPVIGVILMVAITVILAAVIATFVLGLGDTQNSAPQVSFDYEVDDDPSPAGVSRQVTVIHAGGDAFNEDNVDVAGTDWGTSGNDITAGQSITVDDPGENARIVYDDPESDSSAVIGELPDP